MNVSIDLPEIEGFEYSGEYRPYKNGEFYLSSTNQATKATCCGSHSHWPILKKKAPVYTSLGMNDLGCIVFGADIRDSDKKYIEIKALEDAMRIIKSMNEDPDLKAQAFDYYAPLKELLK